jgi:uncharacterized protein (TIGR00730 family)
MIRRLCVFCGSQIGNQPAFSNAARELGRAMARRGIELVFGAGHIGLMGVVADTVLAEGGKAIGVIPQSLVDRELAHSKLTALHIVHSMHERKALMADLSDAFVALPGGYGTLDELFEILTWRQLRFHAKPVGMLNIEKFFDPLLGWIEHAIESGFVKEKYRKMLFVEENIDPMLNQLFAVEADVA